MPFLSARPVTRGNIAIIVIYARPGVNQTKANASAQPVISCYLHSVRRRPPCNRKSRRIASVPVTTAKSPRPSPPFPLSFPKTPFSSARRRRSAAAGRGAEAEKRPVEAKKRGLIAKMRAAGAEKPAVGETFPQTMPACIRPRPPAFGKRPVAFVKMKVPFARLRPAPRATATSLRTLRRRISVAQFWTCNGISASAGSPFMRAGKQVRW